MADPPRIELDRAGTWRAVHLVMRNFARGAFVALALVAIAMLVRHTGGAAFLAALHRALPWLPLLLVLEGVRIFADLHALRSLCGVDAQRLSLRAWIGLQLSANAALVILPGGRAVSEAMKVARLSPLVGRKRATSLVAAQHVATMVSVTMVCLLAAWSVRRASPGLAGAMALQGAITLALAVGLRLGLSRGVRASGAALSAKVVNRLAQVVQLAILVKVAGGVATPTSALIASGVSLLGGLVGELSIAQIGCTDAAFALSTSALSLSLGGALVVASLMRFVQLGWCALGSLLTFGEATHV